MTHCGESNSSSQVQKKPFVVYCAEGIVRRFGDDGFQIMANLSACQISGIRGEGFGKWYIKVLLRKGYPGEKMRFNMFCASANQFIEYIPNSPFWKHVVRFIIIVINPKQETWKCRILLYDFGSVDNRAQHNTAKQ